MSHTFALIKKKFDQCIAMCDAMTAVAIFNILN